MSSFDKYLEEIEKHLRETPDHIKDEIWKEVLETTKDHHGPTFDEYIKTLQSVQASGLYRT